ncbi:MAG: YdeI/OmpD-associated family protein [Thermomicrobiales bacterium]
MSGLIDPGPIEFDAEVLGEGGGTWVDVPLNLKQTYGKGNLVPINATFNGTAPYQGILAMMGGDCPMLLIRSDVRAQLGVTVGDRVHVRIELDTKPRVVELPEDASTAVGANPEAQAVWDRLAPSHRREYVRWIEDAKRPETRQRRIEETVRKLSAGEKLR